MALALLSPLHMDVRGSSAVKDRGAGPAATVGVRTVLGVIGEPWTGVGYVRFAQPFRRLRDSGYALRSLGRSLKLVDGDGGWDAPADLLDDVSLVIFPQFVPSPRLADGRRARVVESICREARRRGIPLVYSVDDSLHELEPHNPEYERIRDSFDNLHLLVEQSDAFIVTTEPLRAAMERRQRPVHLLPNAIDPADWARRPARGDRLRVGWSGSSSHLDDMRMLLPAVRRAQARVDFEFVLQGLCDRALSRQADEIRRDYRSYVPSQRETADRFLEVVAMLKSIRHRHVPFCPTGEFFELLPGLDLDLGLCPLLDTPFNRHKSANKFYEYAVTGTTTLASRVTPYADELEATVPNESADWAEAIERFLRDDEGRRRELERQRDYVLRERNIETLNVRWAEALDRLTAARDGGER